MALFDTIRAGASGAGGDYEVERSIRLNRSDSSYLQISRSSDGNRKKWTFSTWLKVAKHGDDLRPIFAFNGTGNNRENFAFESNGKLAYQLRVSGSSKAQIVTNFQFRDPTAWYHIVLIWDSDNGTSADRAIIYVNGVRQEVTTFITPASGSSTFINSTTTHYINHDAHWSSGDYGYAETYFIDGQAYDPTYFAESDTDTEQWVPKKYTSGFSGNSFYLAYTDNSNNTATTIGKDYSGLGNNVTPVNVSVAAWPDNDSLVDTPTNNFATLNTLDKHGNVDTANGNLETASSTGGNHFPIFTAMSMRGGKYYLEYKCLNGDNGMIMSIMNIEHDGGSLATDSTPGNNASAVNKVGFGLLVGSGRTSHNGTLSSPGAYGSALAVNEAETGMCAVDLDNGKIWWGKEGTFFNSGDPANGTNAAFTTIDTDTTWNFCFHVLNNNNLALNWGQHGYSFTPPTGFGRLCTADLPDVDIKNPTAHHETILYSGTGSSNSITGLDFSPDLAWVKRRNTSGHHHLLVDTVRGGDKSVSTNLTDAENSNANRSMTFNSNGVTWNSNTGNANASGGTYALWNWNGGSSTVTNTSGSRTTQVRANQTCGFSILTFNYGSGSQTLGHGLGKPPQWIMGKTLDNSTAWVIFHKSTGANKWFNYNTSPANSGNAVWDNSMPTSTLINLGTGMSNQGDAVFYAWSEIVGFSAFGRYIGNGSTNGPYVHTGFQPAWLMYKNVSQNGGQWFIRDNKRQTGNPNNASLAAESSGSETESSLVDTDFLSNGFKLRETNEGTNNNGIEYIFMAFAKHPVKYTRAV
jgi:hypothetical protein